MTRRLAVIGGDAGGMAAAAQARRTDPSLEIVAFEKSEWTSYSACGIPYAVSGLIHSVDDLVVRTPQEHRDRSRIDVRTRHEVESIDVDKGRLEVRDHGHSRSIQVPFDLLLLGMGARPIVPEVPGVDLPEVHGVQNLADAAALLRRAEESACKNVVVVGAGYIGLEMAEAFVARGARVSVIERSPHVMRTLDGDMAIPIEAAMRRIGIDLRLGVELVEIVPGLVHTSTGPLLADVVVLGLGVEPNSSLAGDAGIQLGVRDAVHVDRRQQTSAPGIYAAGDCAEAWHLVSQRPVHVALGTVANKQGRVAGVNLGGGYARFPGVVGTAITKVCGTEVARTGLTEDEATTAGFEFVSATIESTTTAGYLSDAPPITVKALAEKGTGRLLGAQIVGGKGAGKRIDVIATALHSGLDAQQVFDLDLAYAPPFGPLWDPVAVVAKELLANL
jgi:NADPH-dependent 2,4-dienoyl-CoA reductase/sulfur reductase-like enzyme